MIIPKIKVQNNILAVLMLIISMIAIACGGGTTGTDGGSSIRIEGKLLDQNGQAVEGIDIAILETGDSAITDTNGGFQIVASSEIVSKDLSFLLREGNREARSEAIPFENLNSTNNDNVRSVNLKLNTVDFTVSIENVKVALVPTPNQRKPKDNDSNGGNEQKQEELVFKGVVLDNNNAGVDGVQVTINRVSSFSNNSGSFLINSTPDDKGSVSVKVSYRGKVKELAINNLPKTKATVSFKIRISNSNLNNRRPNNTTAINRRPGSNNSFSASIEQVSIN